MAIRITAQGKKLSYAIEDVVSGEVDALAASLSTCSRRLDQVPDR